MVHWLVAHSVLGYQAQVVQALQNFAAAVVHAYTVANNFVKSAAQGYNGWSG